MRRTTDDGITTDTTDARDAPVVRTDVSSAGPLPGRRRLVSTRAGRGVRACGRLGPTLAQRARRLGTDAGMATAEYAIVTLAAVGFAGLLVVILKSGEVKGLLTGIVRQALSL
ncbi:DUF4244 domain-containing protein [Cellulomonas septica]|uniref:DUF4244 domain-containing protein n=1 Tax=Cellulomonas septica TaxID=285080 RepID=A0ABX1K3Q5_9CELL|nr:DUF4244 domain-containing protein [Cellulomonas septica]NKY41200.1 DUF4244 domain-containing protein [Cellulomonas septica]